MGKANDIRKYLFISVKPEFANKIVDKEKTIELRKVKPHVSARDYVIIYASSPVMAVVGFGTIKEIIDLVPEQMWRENSSLLGIEKLKFDEYYSGQKRSIGIVIDNIRRVSPAIRLDQIRKLIPSFHPPQIYRYIDSTDISMTLSESHSKA
jgi:predicted transcriptional regulator